MKHLLLAGLPATPDDRPPIEVMDKATGERLAEVACASPATFDAAIRAAHGARAAMAALGRQERGEILDGVASSLAVQAEELAQLLVAEGGKPLAAARGEVARCLATFRISAEEARRQGDQVIPIDHAGQARGRSARRRPVPVGVCGFITPFNFPLNLVAHKVAPAVAAGCPFVLKPASLTPLSALAIGEALQGAGLPEGAFSVLPARGSDAESLAADGRIAKLSFTGSDVVGWRLHGLAGRKRVTLELGGNAAVIVDETYDPVAAAKAIVRGAFTQSGQSCISVQRIIATADALPALRQALLEAVRDVPAGDPRDERTVVGPMISEAEAIRVESWVKEAVDRGARLLLGGARQGALVAPTLLESVPHGVAVLDEEVFGPVACLCEAKDFEAALAEANRTRFGLQAGVMTSDPRRVELAWDALEVGGVIAGDVPTWRADAMPYGGIKDSGSGWEGPRYAIESMTEWRLLVERDG